MYSLVILINFNLSEPQFIHLQIGSDDSNLIGLLKENVYVCRLMQFPKSHKHSTNINPLSSNLTLNKIRSLYKLYFSRK